MAYRGWVLCGLFCVACSSGQTSSTDAGVDHSYPDVGRPGALGTPLQGTERQWTWVDFPDSRCRDGSSTGLGVNLSSASPNAVVFLDQGGACFNELTCALNAARFGATEFGAGQNQGIFNRGDADNPVRDWSFVFVPYCTGDVNAGNQPAGSVPNVGAQQFVGYRNLDVFLPRIVPTFPGAQQVLVTGSSAGGFGVLLNADHVARWFQPTPITVLSDSGPPMPTSVVEPCLQQLWNDMWGFQQGVLLDCGADCATGSDYMIADMLHFGWRYPTLHGGLISSTQDSTISLFYSFGRDNCVGGSLAPADFTAGLMAFRSEMQRAGAPIGTYYITDTHHIWLMSDASYATTANGVSLKQWVASLLAGSIQHVGP